MKQTIQSVNPDANHWQKGEKQAWFVNGFFADGSKFSIWNNSEAQAKETISVLTGLVGTEQEYEIDGDRLKGWPGKPAGKSGGGFGGGAAAWRNTKEGAWFEAVARAVNTAVMQANDLESAGVYLAWMLDKLQSAGGQAPPAQPPARPAAKTSPSQPHPGGGSPAGQTTHPSAGGAQRPSGGGGNAEGLGKDPKRSSTPTGQTYDPDAWGGMPGFE